MTGRTAYHRARDIDSPVTDEDVGTHHYRHFALISWRNIGGVSSCHHSRAIVDLAFSSAAVARDPIYSLLTL